MNWNFTDKSLCQFKGISPPQERSLCQQGISTWRQLLQYYRVRGENKRYERLRSQIEMFETARTLELTDVIVNMMPVGKRSRIVSDRYEKALFFDIETSGTSPTSSITMISALLDDREYTFVAGRNLHEFLKLWRQAEIVVTFNGKRFDVPRVIREFKISTVPAHVDLMDEGRVYGLRGGLKAIEYQLGFVREELICCDGLTAIQEWKAYVQHNDTVALNRLMRYNIEDVRSLKFLYSTLLKLSIEGLF